MIHCFTELNHLGIFDRFCLTLLFHSLPRLNYLTKMKNLVDIFVQVKCEISGYELLINLILRQKNVVHLIKTWFLDPFFDQFHEFHQFQFASILFSLNLTICLTNKKTNF